MPGLSIPAEGLALEMDNYRFTEAPRSVDNTGETWRIVQGLRGSCADWDWESAVLWPRAQVDDVTHGRVANSLMQEALLDPFTIIGGKHAWPGSDGPAWPGGDEPTQTISASALIWDFFATHPKP